MLKFKWHVSFNAAGRYICCEGVHGDECLFLAMGFVAWEDRRDPTPLIQKVHAQVLLQSHEWADFEFNKPTEAKK